MASPNSDGIPSDPTKRLDEIEQRAEAATTGPWRACVWDPMERPHVHKDAVRQPHCMPYGDLPITTADAEFIATSRTDVPWLCAQLRGAWREIEKRAGPTWTCAGCGEQRALRTVRRGSPMDCQEYDIECQECGSCDVRESVSEAWSGMSAALESTADERDALRAENARLREALTMLRDEATDPCRTEGGGFRPSLPCVALVEAAIAPEPTKEPKP